MKTTLIETPLKDLYTIEIDYFKDERGFFIEPWNKKTYKEAGLDVSFVQEGHSGSSKNVLRGLHYQDMTAPMGKLVRCVVGEVLDVAVDLRVGSPTFSKWFSVILSAEKKNLIYVPVGFAHGIAVVSDYAEIIYKMSGYYTPAAEGSIIWNDKDINISWPIDNPILSEKDKKAQTFSEYMKNPKFTYEG